MGLHHDGPVDAFWLQLEGRRTVTLGAPVAPGTPQDLPAMVRGPRGVAHARSPSGDALSPAPVDAARRRLPRALAGAVAHVDERSGPRAPRARRRAGGVGRRVGLGRPHTAGLAPSTVDSGPGDRGPAAPRHVPPDDTRRRHRPSARRAPAGAEVWPRCRASTCQSRGAPRRRWRGSSSTESSALKISRSESSPPTRRRSTAGASAERRGARRRGGAG